MRARWTILFSSIPLLWFVRAGVSQDPAARPETVVATADSRESAGAIRFFALGDTGTGGEEQYQVGRAIAEHCRAVGCDFGVLLGDNFYPAGVTSTTDSQWDQKFERPYTDLLAAGISFYAVLGNHDVDEGRDFGRAAHQVAYGQVNSKWIMPARHYTFEAGEAVFIALDTEAIVVNHERAVAVQGDFVRRTLGANEKPWVIAFGHHPYRSNGKNGNAGDRLGRFFEENLCERADLYLAGHDHNLQVLQSPGCKPLLVVSGGGGYGTYSLQEANPSRFQERSHGFVFVTVSGDKLGVQALDAKGNALFTHEVSR